MALMGRNADIKDSDSVCKRKKQSSLGLIKSVGLGKHVDEALGTNSPTRTPNVVNAGLGSYPTLSEAHGHSTASANEEDMNVVGTKVKSMLNSSTGLFFFQFSSMDGLDSMLENGLWFIRNNSLILKKWNSDVNLLKEYVGNVPVWVKLHGVHVTAFSEDGLSAIATKLDVELKDTIVDECPKNIGSGVAKNLKNPSQALRGVPVGPKVGFKLVKQVYRPFSKKNNANTSGNKKKDAESRKEHEILIIDGKLTLLDDEGNPLEKVDYSGDHDSEDEVKPVDNEMASFLASKRVGYGTNSLLEQRMETYENADYDYDPYDDDMYEGQEILDNIQSICDNLDIKENLLRRFIHELNPDDAVFGGVNISSISVAEIVGTLLSSATLIRVDVLGLVKVAAASDSSLVLTE
ncbi:reverse transcriptase domain-containing protein [Tanacetum coccineum]